MKAGKASFSDATIVFDDITGTGELAVDTIGAVPSVSGRLDLDQLDVNPYMPAGAGEQRPAESGPGGWSDDPLDFSALRAFNVDFALTAQGIKAQAIAPKLMPLIAPSVNAKAPLPFRF